MKFLITLAWLGLIASASAGPKFAVVRVTDIYRSLPSTILGQKQINEQKQALRSNERAKQLQIIVKELRGLQTKLQENKDQLDSENGKKMLRDYEIKRQEAQTLQQDFEDYCKEEGKRISKELVEKMRASLNRINSAAEQIAKKQNFDGVMDISGNSNTGVPFVLYSSAKQTDISDMVVEFLGEKKIETDETNKTGAAAE